MAEGKEREFDLISMGRAAYDLYAKEIGVPFVEVESYVAYVGGCPANIADIALTIDDVLNAPISSCKVLLISGTGLSRNPSRDATVLAAEQARAAGTAVFFDFDLRTDQWYDPRSFGIAVRSLLPMIDVAIGTEDEIKAVVMKDAAQISVVDSQVSGADVSGDLDVGVQLVLELGSEVVVVKRGERRASVFTADGGSIYAPGFPVEIYNTMGAGDAFASGLIYSYIKGWDWYKAARFANANGAIIVTRHGCSNFMAYEAEVMKFIEERGGF